MPLYEYICEADKSIIELRRSMADADAPVKDPENRGRTFTRRLSAFQATTSSPSRDLPLNQGCCPCGRPGGGCSPN